MLPRRPRRGLRCVIVIHLLGRPRGRAKLCEFKSTGRPAHFLRFQLRPTYVLRTSFGASSSSGQVVTGHLAAGRLFAV